jgi:excinuclease UvrABC helicase subunit UvrB
MAPLDDRDLLPHEIAQRLSELRQNMLSLAKDLRYEEAARVRDQIHALEARQLEFNA